MADLAQWDASIDQGLRPVRGGAVATVVVDGEAVLACEGSPVPIRLDPVTTVIWGALDGTVSVGEMAADLVDAVGVEPAFAASCVEQLVRLLAAVGMLEEPASPRAKHDRWFGPVERSCAGARLAIDEVEVVSLRFGTEGFRMGSNDEDVVHEVREQFVAHLGEGVGDESELFVARIQTEATSPRTPRRRHLLLDHEGTVVYSALDRGTMLSVVERTVHDWLAASESGAWYRLPALRIDDSFVLVHPSLETALHAALPTLRRRGAELHPSPFIRLDSPPGPITALVGEVDSPPRAELVRGFSMAARHADQGHLDAIANVVSHASYIDIEDMRPSGLAATIMGAT